MTKPANEIHSVKDLLDILNTLGEAEHGKTRFFRGHSKSSYLMRPNIYRQHYLIENEDKIIRDAIVNCPDDFSPNDTLFEKLVKLQHYGYATRLLDLTSNALVALYFAALSQEAEDGELIILDIPDEQIKYDDSDTVAILTALGLLSHHKAINISEYLNLVEKQAYELTRREHEKEIEKMKQQQQNLTEPMNEEIDIRINIYQEAFKYSIEKLKENYLNYFNDNNLKQSTLKNILDLNTFLNKASKSPDIQQPLSIEDIIECQNNLILTYGNKIINDFIKYLIHTLNNDTYDIFPVFNDLYNIIKSDKPYFERKINPFHFNKVVCVRAKLNNPRILRQQGLFLLFGINGTKVNPANVPDEWLRKVNNQKIIIKNKKQILRELKSFGISKQTLFPELESQAQEIMAQYKPK